MNPLTFSQLAVMTGGKLLTGDSNAFAHGVSTDSRRVSNGDVFFALQGETFDGHHFLTEVAEQGAAVLVVSDYPSQAFDCGVILVTDTLLALQNLARHYRRQLQCKVIAITGSNGKTSTKDLTATVLEAAFTVCKTQGNLNNHIGLPLSVLAIEDQHNVAILEIGMNHRGEIAPLAAIAQPDVAIITNVGVAHIEFLGSREEIASEKSALAENVNPDGTVILNANDEFANFIQRRCQGRVLTAGLDAGDVRASDLATGSEGSHFNLAYRGESAAAFLPLPGRHMAVNATLAVAAGVTLGMTLQACADALRKARLTAGRLQNKLLGGLHFLDDSYNANPDSMVAALGALRDLPTKGRKIAVLGEMGELGSYAETGYRQVGKNTFGLDLLITVGEPAALIGQEAKTAGAAQIFSVDEVEEAVALLQTWSGDGDWILVKGSRSARMERVVQAFENPACFC